MSTTTSQYTFNQTPLTIGRSIEQPPEQLVKNTLGLWNASAEDALRYGGDITRAALSAMNLRNDRKNVVVDVKVHMLMAGQCPAIPGWHTDGVPRQANGSPFGGEPNLDLQRDGGLRPPRYHLLVTGEHCLTEFIRGEYQTTLSDDIAMTSRLYEVLTREVNDRLMRGTAERFTPSSCTVTEWDWWQLHQGTIATGREWRYLIRVTETDYLEPQRDLRDVLRTQQNVYVPKEFGW